MADSFCKGCNHTPCVCNEPPPPMPTTKLPYDLEVLKTEGGRTSLKEFADMPPRALTLSDLGTPPKPPDAREGLRALFRKHGLTPHESLIGDLITGIRQFGRPERFARAMGQDLEKCIILLQECRSAAEMKDNAEVTGIPDTIHQIVEDRDEALADLAKIQAPGKALADHLLALTRIGGRENDG